MICPRLPRQPAPFFARVPLLALALLLSATAAAQATRLTVTVAGVRDGRGHVRIGVCERAQFLSEICSYHAVVSSKAGSVTTVISGIQPGMYAIAAYQDATDAGHLRRNLIGIPKDGSGFSRNPPPRMGPPAFADCALTIGTHDAAVTVMLRYF